MAIDISEVKAFYMDMQIHLLEDLYYPNAINWMWDYCIPLGKWTDEESGDNYDLGIHIYYIGISAANVYGDNDGSYLSGSLKEFKSDIYHETKKRAIELFGEELFHIVIGEKNN